MPRLAAVLTLAVLLAAPALSQEPNPLYDHWSKFGPGTFVEMETVQTMMGNETTSRIVYTLVEVTDAKVVLEMKSVVNGVESKYPFEYAARLTQEEVDIMKNARNQAEVEQGTEDVEVQGTTFACKTAKTADSDAGTWSKTWTCDEMPGMSVRLEMDMGALQQRSKVVRFEIK